MFLNSFLFSLHFNHNHKIMKRIFTLLALTTLTFSTFSCSSDDSSPVVVDPPVVKDKLIGKWDLKTFSMEMTAEGQEPQIIEDQSVEGVLVMQYDFKEDNTIDFLIQQGQQAEQSGTGTYTKSGNSVTITLAQTPQTFTLSNLADTKMSLKMTEQVPVNGVTYTTVISYNFEKM